MRSRGPLLAVAGAVVLAACAGYAFALSARVDPPRLGPEVVVTATPERTATESPRPTREAEPVPPAPPREADDDDDDGSDGSDGSDDEGDDDD